MASIYWKTPPTDELFYISWWAQSHRLCEYLNHTHTLWMFGKNWLKSQLVQKFVFISRIYFERFLISKVQSIKCQKSILSCVTRVMSEIYDDRGEYKFVIMLLLIAQQAMETHYSIQRPFQLWWYIYGSSEYSQYIFQAKILKFLVFIAKNRERFCPVLSKKFRSQEWYWKYRSLPTKTKGSVTIMYDSIWHYDNCNVM